MLNDAKSVTSVAACAPLPFGAPRDAKSHPLRDSASTTDILTVSDNPTLDVYLSGLFKQSGWTIVRRRTCEAGVSFLIDNPTAVVVCEESLPDAFWHDAAMVLSSLPDAPALVVIGEDQSLAHEVHARGGFDALIRPLRESEVLWTIASAWHAWMKRRENGGNGVPKCYRA